jgi:hypothetical protein
MTGVMDMITGASARRARAEQEQARRATEVAQNRQLSELQRTDSSVRRRRQRGRRLFADAGENELQGNLA